MEKDNLTAYRVKNKMLNALMQRLDKKPCDICIYNNSCKNRVCIDGVYKYFEKIVKEQRENE